MHARFLLVAVILSGCGSSSPVESPDEEPPVPVSVTASPTALALDAIGAEAQLQATVVADDGTVLDEPVTWSGNDAGVATVSSDGLVTAVANGQTEVIATVGSLSDTLDVQVQQLATSFVVTAPAPGLVMGEAGTVSVDVTDRLGTTVQGWSGLVSIALSGNQYGAQLTGTDTSTAADGVANFTDLIFSRPGSFRLMVSSEALTGTSTPLDVDIRFRTLDVGTEASCGIATDGGAYCWGRNEHGGLGIGQSGPSRSRPVRIPGDLQWAQIHAGAANDASAKDGACGVTDTGAAYCWGYNGVGRLGNGTSDVASPVPVEVSGGLDFAEVSVAANHACGRDVDGAIHCWGLGGSGSLGIGFDPGDRTIPVPTDGAITYDQVNVGRTGQSCGLATDGTGYCWHSTTLMAGEYVRWSPTAVPGTEVFSRLDAADFLHTCGVTTVGEAVCWGQDLYGELGTGTAGTEAGEPGTVLGGHSWVDVQVGSQFTCGLRVDGAVLCWGHGGVGQLGGGQSGISLSTPALVQGGISFRAISVGTATACGVDEAGRGYCWGAGRHGQRGDGTFDHAQPVPTPVAIPEPLATTEPSPSR